MMQAVVNWRRVVVVLTVVVLMVLAAWVGLANRVSAATSQFEDVPDSNVFGTDINWLADAEVTKGCNPPSNTRFCPSNNVTREQMAAFMHRLSGGDSRTLDGRLDALEAGGGVPSDDLAALEAVVAALTVRLDAVEAENASLQALLAGVSRDETTLLFTGMNLQVVNGEGNTETSNSLGNVIIGYNEDTGILASRTGSHYLVVGTNHSWTSYGGAVIGADNTATGIYASVTGGQINTATGPYASVTGGRNNTANGPRSSVTGGIDNTADEWYASVSGGNNNTADEWYASVSGGDNNTANGRFASVSGGTGNTASGWFASVSGGDNNTASGSRASILGGDTRGVSGENGTYPFCGCGG